MLSEQLKKILFFYFFMLLANLGIFLYEVLVINMLIEQSLIFRGVALLTDGVMAVLFIESFKDLEIKVFKFFNLNLGRHWIISGLKLAIIGPTAYLIKIFIINFVLDLLKLDVPPVVFNKILLAYIIAFLLSFLGGAAWDLFLEKWVNNLKNLTSKTDSKES